ncbi:MAG: hypothetical protein ACTS22_08620 [Phycisphaerales bacterium]
MRDDLLEAVFAPNDRATAAELLELVEPSYLEHDRIFAALLKCSRGELDLLAQAIDLCNTDWRDLLVAAGFADDIHAHEAWDPKRDGYR